MPKFIRYALGGDLPCDKRCLFGVVALDDGAP
jgi:hypothetical protein